MKNITVWMRHRAGWLVAAGIVFMLLVFGPTLYAKCSTAGQRYDANAVKVTDIPHSSAALVFGAGVYGNGQPSLYLENRVKTAVELIKAGRVDHLVMTGDNSRAGYDEPTAMKKLAVSLGVGPEKITLDYAGFNTYDSCYRAKAIFKLTDVTVVTQGYHLPRAVMLCRGLGLQTIGVAAVRQERDWKIMYILREYVSTGKAVLNLIFKPQPKLLGNPEPVFAN